MFFFSTLFPGVNAWARERVFEQRVKKWFVTEFHS